MPIIGTIDSSKAKGPAAVIAWDYIAQAQPSGVKTFSFTSVPDGYHTFKIIGFGYASGESIGNITINNQSANFAEAAGYGSANGTATFAGAVTIGSSQIRRFTLSANGGNNGAPAVITIYNANSTVTPKGLITMSAYSETSGDHTWAYGAHQTTARVSTISLASGNSYLGAGNFAASSFYILYGMKEGGAV